MINRSEHIQEAAAEAASADPAAAAELVKVRAQIKHAKSLGRKARPARVARLQALLEKEWRLAHPQRADEAPFQARRRVEKLVNRYRHLDTMAEQMAPPYEPVPTSIDDAVMCNAMLRMPLLRYLKLIVERPGARGSREGSKLPVAGFLWMAWGSETVSAKAVFDSMRDNGRLAWALLRPGGGGTTRSLRERMKGQVSRADLELPRHTLVELVRQQAERRDEHGQLLYPDAMDVLAVDGCLIEADVAQRKPMDHERAAYEERGLSGVDYVAYREKSRSHLQALSPVEIDPGEIFTPDPGISRGVTGWRWVVLHSLRLNMPVIGGLFPTTFHEPWAAELLLDRLYQIWPEVIVRTVVADGLYDSHVFADRMARGYGIRVCASRGRAPGKKWQSLNIEDRKNKTTRTVKLDWGVPQCDHGSMELFSRESDNCTPDARAKLGLAPGEEVAKDNVAFKFRCRKRMCADVRLRASWNARLATPFPRVDIDDLLSADGKEEASVSIDGAAALRLVLLAMRNQVESLFAAVQQDVVGAKASLRCRWVDDQRMKWLLQTCLIGRAARVIAYNDGLYAEALAEAEEVGALSFLDEDLSNPDRPADVAKILDAKPQVLPVPPRSYSDAAATDGRRLSPHEEAWRAEATA